MSLRGVGAGYATVAESPCPPRLLGNPSLPTRPRHSACPATGAPSVDTDKSCRQHRHNPHDTRWHLVPKDRLGSQGPVTHTDKEAGRGLKTWELRALKVPCSALQGQVWVLSLHDCHVTPSTSAWSLRGRLSQDLDAHEAGTQQVHGTGENALQLPRPPGRRSRGSW